MYGLVPRIFMPFSLYPFHLRVCLYFMLCLVRILSFAYYALYCCAFVIFYLYWSYWRTSESRELSNKVLSFTTILDALRPVTWVSWSLKAGGGVYQFLYCDNWEVSGNVRRIRLLVRISPETHVQFKVVMVISLNEAVIGSIEIKIYYGASSYTCATQMWSPL